jgi:hypothetical protein
LLNKEILFHPSAAGGKENSKLPPLFNEIDRVLIASQNKNKIDAANRWIGSHEIIIGSRELMAESFTVPGEEADWANAILVSRDKVEKTVSKLEGGFGSPALVIASDVVVWINGKPFHNLSRQRSFTQKQLDAEVKNLQAIFSEPAHVFWDVAISVSRPGRHGKALKATIADRIIVCYDPIDPEYIQADFWDNISATKSRSTRIGLIEGKNFKPSVSAIEVIPMKVFSQDDGTPHDWHLAYLDNDQGVNEELLAKAQRQIIGGFPFNGRLDNLANLKPSRQGYQWKLI